MDFQNSTTGIFTVDSADSFRVFVCSAVLKIELISHPFPQDLIMQIPAQVIDL